MEKVKEVNRKLGIWPKLKLAEQVPETSKGGRSYNKIVPNGPHTVKFLAEPTIVIVKKNEVPVKAFKFLVEEKGIEYQLVFPIYRVDEETKVETPSYILPKLELINVGDTKIVEMLARGAIKYIDIRNVDEAPSEEPEDEEEGGSTLDEIMKKAGK